MSVSGSKLNSYSLSFYLCLSLTSSEFRSIIKANIADLTASLLFRIGDMFLKVSQETLPVLYEPNAPKTVFITYSDKVYITLY
jgi:hypothetical protein